MQKEDTFDVFIIFQYK